MQFHFACDIIISMNKVFFNNVYSLQFKRLAKKLFEGAVKKNFESGNYFANVKFVSQDEIKNLNSKFRGVNKVTDVLSFPNFENPLVEAKEETGAFLGDVAICKSVAKRQAKQYGHSLKRELAFLALHGFLHIMGYDHIEEQDEKVMMGLAKQILKENGVER